MGQEFYTYPNESFSGCDMVATFLVPSAKDSTNFHVYAIGELQTVSYSVHMERKSVRAIGNINAKDYVLGPRTIAGTLIFTVFNKHFAKKIMNDINEDTDAKYAFLADELPPFNIIISLANEYGVKAKLVIYGVRLINEGQVMSINDIYTENTYQFVATDLEYLDNENNYISNSIQGRTLYKLDDSDNYNTIIGTEKKAQRPSRKEYYEKTELSYEKISDAYENKNGKIKLFLKPVRTYGKIKIANKDYNIELNLKDIKNYEAGILVELPKGIYTAIWYCDTSSSNKIMFNINLITIVNEIEYEGPIIEFITENTCNLLVNNNAHNTIIYTNKNNGEQFKLKLIGKRVSIYDLSPNTEYEIKSCNEKMTSISKPIMIKTLAFGHDLYQDFMQYIIYNLSNMKYEYSYYYKAVMDAKDLYYKISQKTRYNSITETFNDLLRKYNNYLSSLKTIDFPVKSQYEEEFERYTNLVAATKEIIVISNRITNDKVYGYNKEFIIVNPPELEEKDFCTNNLIVDDKVDSVVFYRIINNNTAQYIRTINRYNFKYYKDNLYLCNFNDKPNSYYYAYATNKFGYKSNRVCFYTLSYEEKSKALERFYEKNNYLNYIVNKNLISYDLNVIDSLSDFEKEILAFEIEKDKNINIVNIPYIDSMNSNEVVFEIKHYYELLRDNGCNIVLSTIEEVILNTNKYKQKISSNKIAFSTLEYGFKDKKAYSIYIENEKGEQISNSLSFIYNTNNEKLNEYYTSHKIDELKQVFKNNGIENEIINNILLTESSDLKNSKFNILDNILNSILYNIKSIINIDDILYTFLNYYFSQFTIVNMNNNYSLKYNNSDKSLQIQLDGCYAAVYELSNNKINSYYIKENTNLTLSIKDIYVINFINKDLNKLSDFVMINPLNKKIYNNIEIEVL